MAKIVPRGNYLIINKFAEGLTIRLRLVIGTFLAGFAVLLPCQSRHDVVGMEGA